MRNAVLAAMAIATTGTGTMAAGQPGAPVAAPMQAGGWGASGWQAGDGYAPAPSAPPAAYNPQAAAAPGYGYGPAPAAGPGTMLGYAPPPRAYKPVRVGKKLPGGYADPIYTVTDWRGYGLEQPYPGTRWVRYFDDAILADAHGRAIIVRPVAWNAPRHRRPAPTMQPMQGAWAPPMASKHTERHGNTVVTTEVIPPPRGFYGGGYGPDYGWGPGVTVTPSVVTTTTTTITEPSPRATRRHRARRR